MLNNLITSLMKRCNLNYAPDQNLPDNFLARVLMTRLLWLGWGVLRTGKRVFVSPCATLINARNIHFGRHVTIEPRVTVNAVAQADVRLGDNAKLGEGTKVMCTAHMSHVGKYFHMGNYSACGEYCYFGAAGGIKIGDNVIMGQYVSFHAQEHDFSDPAKPIRDQGTFEKGIVINDDCWIGAKATILDGTLIGSHSVIAAGAVVKGIFPDNVVLAGNPARIIRTLNNKPPVFNDDH